MSAQNKWDYGQAVNPHYYGRVAAFLVGLFFIFVNEHLDEPVEMVSLT